MAPCLKGRDGVVGLRRRARGAILSCAEEQAATLRRSSDQREEVERKRSWRTTAATVKGM
ncbi:MAG: hypothetical protein QOH57_4901 [Mycobacterium sp.]|nr:hypothetical protein [Mycobacterium sp.]